MKNQHISYSFAGEVIFLSGKSQVHQEKACTKFLYLCAKTAALYVCRREEEWYCVKKEESARPQPSPFFIFLKTSFQKEQKRGLSGGCSPQFQCEDKCDSMLSSEGLALNSPQLVSRKPQKLLL